MTYDAKEDCIRDGWARGEVGVWYGGWSAADWYAGQKLTEVALGSWLGDVNRKRGLAWDVPVRWLQHTRAFAAIPPTDVVLSIFDGTIYLGHLTGPLRSDETSPLNKGKELFKYRVVQSWKQFALADLPDSFRLLPSAGRSAVHSFTGTNHFLVGLLVECQSAADIWQRFRALPPARLLELLGPGAWESLCLGYLIIEEGFVPTGLAAGRTLKDFDHIGVSLSSGARILAQCKNDRGAVSWRTAFGTGLEGSEEARVFLFAWGGCKDRATLPPHVTLLDGPDILRWLESERSRGYWDLWTPLS